MGFLSSLLTAPGTNAAKAQQKRQKALIGETTDLRGDYLRGAQGNLDYGLSLEPMRRNAVNAQLGGYDSLLGSLSTGNLQNSYMRQGNAQGNSYDLAGQRASRRAMSSGAGSGTVQGLLQSYQNQGTQARNRGLSQAYDPMNLAQAASQRLGIQGQRTSLLQQQQSYNPYLQPYLGLAGIGLSEQPVQVGPGLLDIAGSFLPQLAGGLLGGGRTQGRQQRYGGGGYQNPYAGVFDDGTEASYYNSLLGGW